MVAAFKTLCDLASFEANENDEATEDDLNEVRASNNGQAKSKSVNYSGMTAGSFANGLTLNVNIELHLPATQEAEVYDALFASLRRHLLET
jgi:hypothetical protein